MEMECEIFLFLSCQGPLAFISELMHQWPGLLLPESMLKHISQRFSQLCYELILSLSQFWLNNANMNSNQDVNSNANVNSNSSELLSASSLSGSVVGSHTELILTPPSNPLRYILFLLQHQWKEVPEVQRNQATWVTVVECRDHLYSVKSKLHG